MTILQIEIEDSSPEEAHCDVRHLNVRLADGRILQTPLWWYPRLWNAGAADRNVIELMPMGLHWPQLDEDISIASMLRGQKAPGAKPPAAA
jgi:hypothetical protein